MTRFAKQAENSDLRREPRHLALARDLHEQIRSGQLVPGDRLPSFNELRERWGVGRDTLERMYKVLERDGLITREHRRGVYVAHPQAPQRTGAIGFVVSSQLQRHPYYVHLLEGVRREAELSGVEVLLLSEKASIRWEKIDGVIYQLSINDYFHTLNVPPGLARVTLIYAHPHVDSVIADDYVGMTQAMEHLLQQGHRRIAFLTQELRSHAASHQRIAAYHDALRSQRIKPQATWMRCLPEPDKTERTWEQTGHDDMKQWLAEGWSTLGCTAILAHNDEVAIGVIAALQETGLRVPEDVSVIGFDGTEIAHFHRPRLATVKVPLREIGARGFELLMQQVNRSLLENLEERLPLRLTLPTQFYIGQTTAPAAR